MVASTARLWWAPLAAPDAVQQLEQSVDLFSVDVVVGGELIALLIFDRAGVGTTELVGEDEGHLALVEVRRGVVEPTRDVDGDVAPAASHGPSLLRARESMAFSIRPNARCTASQASAA